MSTGCGHTRVASPSLEKQEGGDALNSEAVEHAISSGIDLNAEDAAGNTLLTRAIKNQQKDVVCRLLACEGIDLDAVSSNEGGATPLFIASQVGNAELVQLLLQAGSKSIGRADKDGSTPLHIAAVEGHLPVVKLLLSAGSTSIDKQNNFGATPLYMAALNGRLQVVQLLLQHGSKLILAAIIVASNAGHTECVRLLETAANAASQKEEAELKKASIEADQMMDSLLLEEDAVAPGKKKKKKKRKAKKPDDNEEDDEEEQEEDEDDEEAHAEEVHDADDSRLSDGFDSSHRQVPTSNSKFAPVSALSPSRYTNRVLRFSGNLTEADHAIASGADL